MSHILRQIAKTQRTPPKGWRNATLAMSSAYAETALEYVLLHNNLAFFYKMRVHIEEVDSYVYEYVINNDYIIDPISGVVPVYGFGIGRN